MDLNDLLIRELHGSVAFYLDHTNLTPGSPGFGLTLDSTKHSTFASIAAVGFALTAYVIAAERGLLPRARARELVIGTLDTLLQRVPHHRGFFAHFLHIETAARWGRSEYSTIDTALCLNGVITAAAYFADDAAVGDRAEAILARVDWGFLVFQSEDGYTRFRMAWNPDRDGDYVEGDPGFISQWDMAAEQKMMYFQAAERLAPDLARALYAGFRRDRRDFAGQSIIVNPGGTLFAYQFSEAWFDSAAWRDPDGIDWFENTRLASLANRQFCLDHADRFATYGPQSWGVSAGDSPWGYDVSGATPALVDPTPNGTVSIYGAVSTLPFIPDHALALMAHLSSAHPQTWGKYGFFDSYNLAVDPPWYSSALYGIDKGCSMIMIENYLSGLIWQVYTTSPTMRRALAVLGFTPHTEAGHAQL